MSSFSDKNGEELQLTIDVAAMRRAKSKDIDLSMPVNQLQEFVFDDVFLVDALHCVTNTKEPIAKFEARFDGKVLEEAREALWQALEEYFSPGKAEMLRAALDSVRKETDEALSELTGSGSRGVKES